MLTLPKSKPASQASTHLPIIHFYPADPRYRLSGQELPQQGDVAVCGHVKKNPKEDEPDLPITCIVCKDLENVPLNKIQRER